MFSFIVSRHLHRSNCPIDATFAPQASFWYCSVMNIDLNWGTKGPQVFRCSSGFFCELLDEYVKLARRCDFPGVFIFSITGWFLRSFSLFNISAVNLKISYDALECLYWSLFNLFKEKQCSVFTWLLFMIVQISLITWNILVWQKRPKKQKKSQRGHFFHSTL